MNNANAKRYTVDDFTIESHVFDSEYHDRWAEMMRQAARTESDVQALVAELKAMADRWSSHRDRRQESYQLGVEEGMYGCASDLTEVLARFQS